MFVLTDNNKIKNAYVLTLCVMLLFNKPQTKHLNLKLLLF